MTLLRRGEPAIILAPMEGVTDRPMRTFLTSLGGFTHCVSEFLRISENIPPKKTYFEHVPELKWGSKTPSEIPVFFQLLGGNPEKLAQAALVAAELGAPAIDLNFGCPAPTVNRNDGGATLLKYPQRIFDIVKAVRDRVPQEIPVSAKFRLGWDSFDPIYENAQRAVAAGAQWITIHGRTRVAGYRPPAYWGPIGRLKKELPIPVVANGDIWTLDDFKRCQDETGCEHYMLGRGAVVNPFLASAIWKELSIGRSELTLSDGSDSAGKSSNSQIPQISDWKNFFQAFCVLNLDHSEHQNFTLCRLKQWAKMISLRHPFELYEKIKTIESFKDVAVLLE